MKNKVVTPILAFLASLMAMTFLLAPLAYGPHVMDSSGMLRAAAAGNLTTTETLPANPGKQVDGTPVGGVTVRLHVPAVVASSTLDLTIQHSDDGTTWTTILTFPQVTTGGVGEYRRRLSTPKKYLRYVATTATSPNFGAVQIGFDSGGEQANW